MFKPSFLVKMLFIGTANASIKKLFFEQRKHDEDIKQISAIRDNGNNITNEEKRIKDGGVKCVSVK